MLTYCLTTPPSNQAWGGLKRDIDEKTGKGEWKSSFFFPLHIYRQPDVYFFTNTTLAFNLSALSAFSFLDPWFLDF